MKSTVSGLTYGHAATHRAMVTDVDDISPGCITSLKAQVKTPGRVSVFIDGRFAFGVNRDVVLDFGLKKGLELSVEAQLRILDREAECRARATALNFISYRDRSEEEIRRRLARSDYREDVIDSIVEYLRRSGLVDDHKFARSYAEGRFKTGGYGPRRVRHDLRKKGIARAVADQAVDAVFNERDEVLGAARALGTRRWDKLERESDDRRRRKKVYDYLVRRGYPHAMARSVIEELIQ